MLTGACQALERPEDKCRVMNLVMNSNVFFHFGNKRGSKYQSTFTKVVFCYKHRTTIKGAARSVAFVSAWHFTRGREYLLSGRGLGCDRRSVKREVSAETMYRQREIPALPPPCVQLSQIALVASYCWLLLPSCSQRAGVFTPCSSPQ